MKLHDGLLDFLELVTLGIRFQDNTLSELKQKFDEPISFKVVPYQNSFGAKFNAYSADWYMGDVYVHFDAVHLGELNKGVVEIRTSRSFKEHMERMDESWSKRERL